MTNMCLLEMFDSALHMPINKKTNEVKSADIAANSIGSFDRSNQQGCVFAIIPMVLKKKILVVYLAENNL